MLFLFSHVMDHLFALYGLGGSGEALDEVYAAHDYQKPAFGSHEAVTNDNFLVHLGDDKYALLTIFFLTIV